MRYLEQLQLSDLLLHCGSSRVWSSWLICILCHKRQLGMCELVEKADNVLFVPLVYIYGMFALSSDRKLVVHKLRFKVHIVFEEQFSGALHVVWRFSLAPNNFKTLILLAPMSQIVATTCASAFCRARRTSFRNLTKKLDFRGWSSKQLFASTFEADHGPRKREHDLQYCKFSKPSIQSSF
jgi:hypothetical protein